MRRMQNNDPQREVVVFVTSGVIFYYVLIPLCAYSTCCHKLSIIFTYIILHLHAFFVKNMYYNLKLISTAWRSNCYQDSSIMQISYCDFYCI